MKKALLILPILMLGVGCGPQQPSRAQTFPAQTINTNNARNGYGPDCDYDDMLEFDTDCGFPAGMQKPKTQTVTKYVYVKPSTNTPSTNNQRRTIVPSTPRVEITKSTSSVRSNNYRSNAYSINRSSSTSKSSFSSNSSRTSRR